MTREARLAEEIKSLDLQKQQLKQEAGKRQQDLKEAGANRIIKDVKKGLHQKWESARDLRLKADEDGQKISGLEESLKERDGELVVLKEKHQKLSQAC